MRINIRAPVNTTMTGVSIQSPFPGVTQLTWAAMPFKVAVYANTVDLFSSATLIGITSDNTYTDTPSDVSTPYYYWLRVVDTLDRPYGDVYPGALASGLSLAAIGLTLSRPFVGIPVETDFSSPDLTNTGTTLSVVEGGTALQFTTGTPANGQWSVSLSAVNVTPGAVSVSGTSALVANLTAITAGDVSGSIKFTVSGKRANGSPFTREIEQQFVKARKGVDGTSGVSARGVSLKAATQAFTYNEAGSSPSPASSVITATGSNTTGAVYYEFVKNGVTVQNTTSNTYSYTPPASHSTTADTIEVRLREGSNSSTVLATDTISMFGLKLNTDGITVALSNEAHSIPCNSSGTPTSYAGSGTNISVWLGATALTYGTSGPNTFSVSASGSGINPGSASGTGAVRTYANASSMSTNPASITFTITVRNGASQVFTLTRTQSFSKSIEGVAGTNGTNGTNGVRGAGRWHIPVASLPATSTAANTAWNGWANTPGSPVLGDQAWFYTGTAATPTSQKVWISNGGTSWTEQTEVVDGNLLVTGTVTAEKVSTSQLSAISANLGTVVAGQMDLKIKRGNLSLGEDSTYSSRFISMQKDGDSIDGPLNDWRDLTYRTGYPAISSLSALLTLTSANSYSTAISYNGAGRLLSISETGGLNSGLNPFIELKGNRPEAQMIVIGAGNATPSTIFSSLSFTRTSGSRYVKASAAMGTLSGYAGKRLQGPGLPLHYGGTNSTTIVGVGTGGTISNCRVVSGSGFIFTPINVLLKDFFITSQTYSITGVSGGSVGAIYNPQSFTMVTTAGSNQAVVISDTPSTYLLGNNTIISSPAFAANTYVTDVIGNTITLSSNATQTGTFSGIRCLYFSAGASPSSTGSGRTLTVHCALYLEAAATSSGTSTYSVTDQESPHAARFERRDSSNGVYTSVLLGTNDHAVYVAKGLITFDPTNLPPPTPSGTTLVLDSNNSIARLTSSERYKKAIEPVSLARSKDIVASAKPVWYRSENANGNPNWSYDGLLAEDVALIEPRLVTWVYSKTKTVLKKPATPAEPPVFDSVTGEMIHPATEAVEAVYEVAPDTESPLIPDAVNYAGFVPHLLNVIQQQQQQIDELIEAVGRLQNEKAAK